MKKSLIQFADFSDRVEPQHAHSLSFSSQAQCSLFFAPLSLKLHFHVSPQATHPFPVRFAVRFQPDMVLGTLAPLTLLETSLEPTSPSGASTWWSCHKICPDETLRPTLLLEPGQHYRLMFCIDRMEERLSAVKSKYLQQVSVVTIEMLSGGDDRVTPDKEGEGDGEALLDGITVVCQAVRPPSTSGVVPLSLWQRRLYNPLC